VADSEDCRENEISDSRISMGGCGAEEGGDNMTKL